MLTLKAPVTSAQRAFTTCIGGVRNPVLAARLAAATPAVVEASREFDRAARLGSLHLVATHDIVAPDVTVVEMEKVYTQRMAKADSPGRDMYDEIFASSPGGRCPLCTQRSVASLDHYLPKAYYPALAVTPCNLVPACSDCNKAKLGARPVTPEQVSLHPYYDDLGDEIWLQSTVVETAPAAVTFAVVRPAGWDDLLSTRVARHFRTLGLGRLFAAEAADELVNVRHQLTMLRTADADEAVRDELARRAASCGVARPNGWRAATYRAWHESDWFCDGGFQSAGEARAGSDPSDSAVDSQSG
jgi:hypothetical protein